MILGILISQRIGFKVRFNVSVVKYIFLNYLMFTCVKKCGFVALSGVKIPVNSNLHFYLSKQNPFLIQRMKGPFPNLRMKGLKIKVDSKCA